jgi:hypothetical protein
MLTRAKDRWWKMKWSPPNSKPWSHPPLPSGENYYRRLGLRDLLLNLPLMVAARLLLSRAGCGRSHRANGHPGEGRFFMVSSHTSISTSRSAQRFLTFRAQLLERVFKELLPQLKQALPLTNSSPPGRKHTVGSPLV